MRKITQYSEAIKASLLTKMMAIHGPSVVELGKEFNIPYSTVYTWKKNMLKNSTIDTQPPSQRPKDKSPQAKLQAVLDTLGKTAQEQSAYCRTQGIYSHHLETWKVTAHSPITQIHLSSPSE